MAILIDKPLWWHRGERWAHLASDASYDELHAFADALGVPRRGFHGDHYDIPERYWQTCVDLGAIPTDSRSLVRKLRDAGLRKRPSRTVNTRATSYSPMKAVPGNLPAGDGWGFEIKWDGMRAVVTAGADGVRAHSSRLNDITHRFPELQALGDIFGQTDAVLDGEIVAFGDNGLPSFGRLQSRMHLDRPHDIEQRHRTVPVVYVIFDLLRFDGTETLRLPLTDRRRLLESVLEPGPTWQLSTLHTDGGPELLGVVQDRGMEGLVAKRLTSNYSPGQRSPDWVKVKPRRRQELVVGGWLSGVDHRSDTIAAVLVGYYDDEGLRFAGRVGSGLDDDEVSALRTSLDHTTLTSSPFVDPIEVVRGRSVHFVEPQLVVEVAFGEWTSEGRLRHPVYVGRRADVDPAAVTREPEPIDVSPAQADNT